MVPGEGVRVTAVGHPSSLSPAAHPSEKENHPPTPRAAGTPMGGARAAPHPSWAGLRAAPPCGSARGGAHPGGLPVAPFPVSRTQLGSHSGVASCPERQTTHGKQRGRLLAAWPSGAWCGLCCDSDWRALSPDGVPSRDAARGGSRVRLRRHRSRIEWVEMRVGDVHPLAVLPTAGEKKHVA